MKKCIDDVLGWSDLLLQLFPDTAYFLYHKGSHGIIQNPKKFVWGQQEHKYVGSNGIEYGQQTKHYLRYQTFQDH